NPLSKCCRNGEKPDSKKMYFHPCSIRVSSVTHMQAYLLVAVGGAIGSVTRFWMTGVIDTRIGGAFPWGTIAVNVLGCLVIGFLAAFHQPDSRWIISPAARQFLMIGICGGY